MSASEPWLSILMPVYNVAAYLDECLESIRAQLAPGIEVIALDDASSDASAEVLARAQARFGAALHRVSHERNRGVAVTRNDLLQQARGRHVWFVDADDILRPGAVRSLQHVVERESPDLVMCDFRVHRRDFRLKHRLRGELHRHTFSGPARQLGRDHSALVAGLLVAGQLHSWSKIATRAVWQRVRFPEDRYFEDIAVIPQLVDAVDTYYYAPETWIDYRQRPGSILEDFSAQKMRHLIHALRDLHAQLPSSHTALDAQALFSIRHFFLKSHASMARRIGKRDLAGSADGSDLAVLLKANLDVMFPEGLDGILGDYRRRGWLLRAHRARSSLQRAGLYRAGALRTSS